MMCHRCRCYIISAKMLVSYMSLLCAGFNQKCVQKCPNVHKVSFETGKNHLKQEYKHYGAVVDFFHTASNHLFSFRSSNCESKTATTTKLFLLGQSCY